MRIKILFIVDNLSIGGAQRHLVRLANGLKSRGYSVKIISLGANDDSLIKDINVPIVSFKMDCIWRFSFWKNFIRLMSFLKRERPSIAHTYLNTSNVFGTFAGKLANIPIIVNSRRDMGHFRSGLIGKLERFAAGLSDKVVCVSKAVQENVVNVEKIPLDKTVVIYNGVDIDKFNNVSCDISGSKRYTTVSMVATMNREKKGHIYFIKAAEEILRKRKDIRFILIGDGRLRSSLEDYVNKNGISNYFDFRGKRTDLTKELYNTDILVVPSESEGCSNALLEAMAMGITPVATAVEGNLEIVEDGVSGLLVEPRNPSAIAKGITVFLDGPDKLQFMAAKAKERVINNFSFSKMISNFDRLYKELIEDKDLSNNRLKVAYVVSLFPCWSETFILNEIIELTKKGFDVEIFSIRRDLEKFIHNKAKPFIGRTTYINFLKIPLSFLHWLLKKPQIILSFFRMVLFQKYKSKDKLFKNIWCVFVGCFFANVALKKKVKHIHAHFATYPAFVAMVVSKLTGVPFTFTAHAHDIFLDKALLKEKAAEAKTIITISDYNRRHIIDYCKDGLDSKTKVIHCGIDVSEYPRSEGEKKKNIIVSVGRLIRMKGFDYLIRACRVIKDKVDFKCLIIGDGPQYKYLSQLIENYGLKDKIILKGVIDNSALKDVLKDAKVFVLPSVWDNNEGQDGIPLVLIEAMALGVPVISTKISGIPELIKDRETGILIELENTHLFAEKIVEVMRDKQLQNKLSSNARRKVEREFNLSKSVELLIKVFAEK